MNRDKLLIEREQTHGSFKRTAELSQRLKYLLNEFGNPDKLNFVQQEALDMIVVKMARILSGDPFCREHWLDIIGYAKLALEAIEDEPKTD